MLNTAPAFKRSLHVALLWLAATGVVNGQTVVNGSFEIGTDPGSSIPLDAPNSTAIFGWTLQSGSIDYIGTRWVAGDGVRCVDLTGVSAGTLSQMINGFVPGQDYRLSFLMAGNPEAGPLVKSLQASIGSVSQTFSFDGTGFTPGNMGWSQRTLDFTASSSSLTLSFLSLNPGTAGPALDRILITPVPEPGTLALLALGGAVSGWWLRRRKCA